MDADHISDLFSRFGPVTVRRMFGGAGIIADGLTFAVVFEGVVFFRADERSIPAFKEEGSAPFVYPYAKHPRVRRNPDAAPFWRMPERLYDDPEEAARWAERALEIARRKKAGKKSAVKKSATKGATEGKPPVQSPPMKRAKKRAAKPPATGKRARRR